MGEQPLDYCDVRRVLVVLVAGWLAGCVSQSATRVRDWSSDLAIWTAATHTDPGLLRPHANRAVALMQAGRYADAEPEWIAAGRVLSRDDASLPFQPDLKRQIYLSLASGAWVRHDVQAASAWAAVAGCAGHAPVWICPPN